MQTGEALTALTALAHPTRLDAYRMLIRAEPGGLSTGQMVEATGLGQGHFECGQYARGLALKIMVPLTIFDGKGAADFPCFGVVDCAYVSGKDMRKMIYQLGRAACGERMVQDV